MILLQHYFHTQSKWYYFRSACLSVCSCSNFRKHWPRNFNFFVRRYTFRI